MKGTPTLAPEPDNLQQLRGNQNDVPGDLSALHQRIGFGRFQDGEPGGDNGFDLSLLLQMEEGRPILFEELHSQSVRSVSFDRLPIREQVKQNKLGHKE